MSDSGQGGYGLWTVVKAVLIVVGLIYLIQLLTWAVHWGVIALAVGGTGYVVYRLATGFGSSKKALPEGKRSRKLLTNQKKLSPFDKRLRELEEEERLLDHKIGL